MQAVQCAGDATPVPLYFWDGFPLALGAGKTHTCRKIRGLRDWMTERNRNMVALDG